MSHLTKLDVVALQKNERELIEALENRYGKGSVRCTDTATELNGYEKNSSGRSKRANLIIDKETLRKVERTSGYNDMGFERTKEGGYNLHYDTADVPKTAIDRVMQDYAERVVTKTMKARGYSVHRTELKDGQIELKLRN